jgi:hypothetical protein
MNRMTQLLCHCYSPHSVPVLFLVCSWSVPGLFLFVVHHL